MNEIRVASIAFAAYFVISADGMSMTMSGLPVRTNGAYNSSMTFAASSESTPTTTRSGFMKSSTAAPSLRNSGLEHTERRAGPLRDLGADPFRRPHRHGAFRDYELGPVHVLADRARHGKHVLQIGRAIFVGRRAYRD